MTRLDWTASQASGAAPAAPNTDVLLQQEDWLADPDRDQKRR